MRPGDLVKYHWPKFLGKLDDTVHDKGVGVVLDVDSWVDSGAPERNFGVNVLVHWPSGEHGSYDESELEIVNG